MKTCYMKNFFSPNKNNVMHNLCNFQTHIVIQMFFEMFFTSKNKTISWAQS